MSWMPIGSPSSVSYSGSESAGWPVILAIGVNDAKSAVPTKGKDVVDEEE